MGRHQKRLSAPSSWPVERKTAVFTVKADAGPHGKAGVPLLVLLRDVLEYADSRKETRYALNQRTVLVNGEPLSDEERPIGMFDILAFTEREEYYRVFPDAGGRLALTPISPDAADSKLGKIVDKREVPGGRTQLNLHDGRNLLVGEGGEYRPGDSIVIDYDDEIVAHFEFEEGALVTAVRGPHAGEIGTVEEVRMTPGSSSNHVLVAQEAGGDDPDGAEEGGGGGFETIAEYVVVIDENFTGSTREERVAADGGEFL